VRGMLKVSVVNGFRLLRCDITTRWCRIVSQMCDHVAHVQVSELLAQNLEVGASFQNMQQHCLNDQMVADTLSQLSVSSGFFKQARLPGLEPT
jgi:hypothetical protein